MLGLNGQHLAVLATMASHGVPWNEQMYHRGNGRIFQVSKTLYL